MHTFVHASVRQFLCSDLRLAIAASLCRPNLHLRQCEAQHTVLVADPASCMPAVRSSVCQRSTSATDRRPTGIWALGSFSIDRTRLC